MADVKYFADLTPLVPATPADDGKIIAIQDDPTGLGGWKSTLANFAAYAGASGGFLKADGTVPLTADWDAGSYKITAEQLESDIATGTEPLIVASTTKVPNLNSDQVDGFDLDQAVLIASSPTHVGLTLSGLPVVGGIVQTDGAGVLSSSVTLPDGTLATTQAPGDNTTKLATTAFVEAAVQTKDTFLELTDTPSSYTAAKALYTVNDAADGIKETSFTLSDTDLLIPTNNLLIKSQVTDSETFLSIQGNGTGNASMALVYGVSGTDFILHDHDNTVSTITFGTSATKYSINNSSLDVDVIIKGDNDAELFFLDAGTDKIGIGKIPTEKLDIDGTLKASGAITFTNLSDGIVKSTSGVLSGGASVDLTSDVTGILPIANGGTNSSTALNNDFVMVSSSGAIVESSTITTTELGLLNGIVSVSTGAGDNDKFVTKGYVDDAITTVDSWDEVMHLGNTFTVLNTENLSAIINQNDTTNNPAALIINNTGSGNDITLPNSSYIKNGTLVLGASVGLTGTRITQGYFTDLEITNMPTVGGTSINANGVLSLTSAEVTQLANIDTVTISNGQWVYLGAMNQGVASGDTVSFADLTVDNLNLNANTLSTTSGDLDFVSSTGIATLNDATYSKFRIETGSSGIAGLELIRSGAGSTDWTVRNQFGVLNIARSLDDGATWLDNCTISSTAGETDFRTFSTTEDMKIGGGQDIYLQTYSGSWVNRLKIAEAGAISCLSGTTFALASGTTVNEIVTSISSPTDDQLATAQAIEEHILTGTEASAPSSSVDTGTDGQWAYSAGYMYKCVGTDTWVRWAVVTSF